MPGRHTSESGPMSPASHLRRTSASGSGPTCAWPMATYHSVAAGSGGAERAASLAASSGETAWVESRSDFGSAAPAAADGSAPAGPPPKALSKAWPSSASSPSPVGVGAGAEAAVGTSFETAPFSARRTRMTWLHFLQRTLTPFGPTFSSEIMYWASQRSQVNFIGNSAGILGLHRAQRQAVGPLRPAHPTRPLAAPAHPRARC